MKKIATMFCEKCGAALPEGARFCSKCGANLFGSNATVNSTNKKPAYIGITVGIVIVTVIGLLFLLPRFVFSPAEELYKSCQYKQAYEKAAQISDTGLGKLFAKGNIEKYAYAYLNDYIEQNGKISTQTSDISTVEVSTITFNDGTMIYFRTFVKTNEYEFMWDAQYSWSGDKVYCSFHENEYTSTGKQGVYTSAGEFSRAGYRNEQSIERTLDHGTPRFANSSALYDYGTSTMTKALSLVKTKLGIPAEHLGFYSYK